MAIQSVPNPHSATRKVLSWPAILLLLFLGAGVGALLLGLLAHHAEQGIWERLALVATGRGHTDFRSQPSIVEKIQLLRRLESVDYTMDKVVEGDRQSLILPDFLAGDKLLLVAHGEVIAGVDLSGFKPENVALSGRSIHVHLPTAQIFTAHLDSTQTRVYSRTTGLLMSADPNLESEVRQKAEQQIREAALADGILDKAKQNARSTIKSLLLSLGYETVVVD